MKIIHFYFINFILLLFLGFSSCKSLKIGEPENKITSNDRHKFKSHLYEASKQKMLGHYDKAIQELHTCLTILPKNSAALYEYSKLLASTDDFEGALNYSQKAVKNDPENIWYQLFLAKIYFKKNIPDKGLEIYKSLTRKHKDDYDLKKEYGNLLFKYEKYNKALALYNQIEQVKGIQEEVSLMKNRIYNIQGKNDLLETQIKKLIKHYPDEVRYRGMLAELYTKMERYKEAQEIYDELLTADKSDATVLISLANFYRIIEDYQNTYLSVKRIFDLDDFEAERKIDILIHYREKNIPEFNNRKNIYELMDILIHHHPDNPLAYSVYADFLIQDSKFEQARTQLRSLIDYDTQSFKVWEQLMFVEIELNDYSSLYKESNEALLYFPNQPLFYLMNGLSALKLDNYQESINMLNMGKDILIEDKFMKSQFLAYLGEAYFGKGEYEKAFSSFENALKSTPNNPLVLNNYAYYLAKQNKNLDKAKSMIKESLNQESTNPDYLFTQAYIFYQSQQFDKARISIEKAIQYDESQAHFYNLYGDILYRLDDTQQALEQWKNAKHAGMDNSELDEKINSKKIIE